VLNLGTIMSAENFKLDAMPLDDLWSLHEQISAILAKRIEAEKHELEKRLTLLNRGVAGSRDAAAPPREGKPRRKYPRVLPKYRNPKTAETWSGRGKQPLWLTAAVKAGRKIEDFRISATITKGQRNVS
jgi:DNA-binding protein H-NS